MLKQIHGRPEPQLIWATVKKRCSESWKKIITQPEAWHNALHLVVRRGKASNTQSYELELICGFTGKNNNNRTLLTWINRHQQHHIHSATEKSLVWREHNLVGYELNWLKGQPRLDSSSIMFESSCSLISLFAGSGRDRREFLEVGM